jgi:hypothetical protein
MIGGDEPAQPMEARAGSRRPAPHMTAHHITRQRPVSLGDLAQHYPVRLVRREKLDRPLVNQLRRRLPPRVQLLQPRRQRQVIATPERTLCRRDLGRRQLHRSLAVPQMLALNRQCVVDQPQRIALTALVLPHRLQQSLRRLRALKPRNLRTRLVPLPFAALQLPLLVLQTRFERLPLY